MGPKGGQGLTTAGMVGHPRLMRPSEALLCQISALPTHVRAWLRMGIDVQPTPLEIKAILTVVPVAVYLVKGPVGKNWAKPWLPVQNRIRKLQNRVVLWTGRPGFGHDPGVQEARCTRGSEMVPVPTRISMAAFGSGFMTNKSTIERQHLVKYSIYYICYHVLSYVDLCTMQLAP